MSALAADRHSLQERLTQHLESSQSATTAMQAQLSTMCDKAVKAEAALCEAQSRVEQLSQEVEQQAGDKAHAEQQVGELKAVEGQLELEVARLQYQLQGVEGQLQV